MKLDLPKVALAAVLLVTGAVAQADPISVFVGYADNLRPSGFFPTNWIGSSNVVSESSAAQSFDSGAIRIDNNSGGTLTISNFQVYFPSIAATFNFWNTLVIADGATGIFTQTFSYNFDSSDFGIFGSLPPASLAPSGSNLIGGCSSPAADIAAAGLTAACDASAPVISFLANGVSESFTDSGQVLDTGGWDFVNNSAYGEDGNESINWNVVGSAAVRGGTSVPEPGSLTLVALALASAAFVRRRA